MSITAVPLKPVKRRVLVYLWAGIAVAAVGAAALAVQTPVDPAATFLAHNAQTKGVKQTPSGLQYQVLTPGSGAPPTDQDVALVNYEGKFVDGTVFDKSQRPFPVPLGEHQVVPGFEEALTLIPKGGKYRVWIKPSLAYGDTARPGMPAHSTLVFDIEMLDFLSKAAVQQLQQQQMMQQQMMQGGGAPGGMPPGAMPGAPGGVPGGAPGGAVPQGN